ncbi:MAG: DUF131 domain-containing protein [Candidatus Bathyarchaeia archaeon]|jgi:uncharacterized membrane protein
MPETSEPVDENAPRNFLAIFILGFSMTLVGLILITVAATVSGGGSTSSGGIIFIGPIPIVFGAGPGASWLILFATVLAVLSVIAFLILHRRPGIARL